MTGSLLSLAESRLYALPISPVGLVNAPPPLFGLAVMVDQAECSPAERQAYADSGIEARGLLPPVPRCPGKLRLRRLLHRTLLDLRLAR